MLLAVSCCCAALFFVHTGPVAQPLINRIVSQTRDNKNYDEKCHGNPNCWGDPIALWIVEVDDVSLWRGGYFGLAPHGD